MSERVAILALLVLNGLFLGLLERRAQGWTIAAADRRHRVRSNLALTLLMVAVNIGFDRAAARAGVRPESTGFGLLPGSGLPGWATLLLVIVTLDGLSYLAHVLLHRLPPAWRIHRVHHSDPSVDVTTAFRQHPLETLWRSSFQYLGVLLLGAPGRWVAVYLALSALNAQLEHAEVLLPPSIDRACRLLFTTPAMHRVHHSRRQAETDTNYSNIFSVWDRLFGTYRAPRPGERIACGLDDDDAFVSGVVPPPVGYREVR